jgi:hypothetical protein
MTALATVEESRYGISCLPAPGHDTELQNWKCGIIIEHSMAFFTVYEVCLRQVLMVISAHNMHWITRTKR